jgi:hypothetical protein
MVPAAARAHKPQIRVPDRSAPKEFAELYTEGIFLPIAYFVYIFDKNWFEYAVQ